eukprot:TRINITY_DN3294_c0_g1_i5.p1 TRINITY_DN3294_c0_g1~~TRINITY_DN3294_c0_g1_i5.p1  ORF type:complete len:134 (-),score=39.78 TRINITY_DN3294_c0_g1_i5:216-617(-)
MLSGSVSSVLSAASSHSSQQVLNDFSNLQECSKETNLFTRLIFAGVGIREFKVVRDFCRRGRSAMSTNFFFSRWDSMCTPQMSGNVFSKNALLEKTAKTLDCDLSKILNARNFIWDILDKTNHITFEELGLIE